MSFSTWGSTSTAGLTTTGGHAGAHFHEGKTLSAAAPPRAKDAPIALLMCPLKHGSEAAIWVH